MEAITVQAAASFVTLIKRVIIFGSHTNSGRLKRTELDLGTN